MSTYKEKGLDIFKNGWHPEKPGTSFKGQLKGLVGRGDDKERTNHTARPLASLKDPASFGPPPVRRQIATPPPLPGSSTAPPPTEEPEVPKSPPKPYHVDTSGLSTSHLPPPPVRRDGSNVVPPPAPAGNRPGPGPPSLPPRLPPRSRASSTSPVSNSGPPPPPIPARISTPDQRPSSSTGLLNQGAINRLGAAGISVPGLGIGPRSHKSTPSPPPPPRPSSSSSQAQVQAQPQSQVSELQSRFARLGRSPSTSTSNATDTQQPTSSAVPATGTTWAQKQAALKTASSFRNDPSSVSLSDAKSAASTFHNFHQRHGDQVAAGVKGANKLHDRYAGTVGAGTGTASGSGEGQTDRPSASSSQMSASGLSSGLSSVAGPVNNKKKPPPPPPPKKRGLSVGAGQQGVTESGAPPPVPLATRPQF
ncbi:hypothetical protein V8F20_007234 [Naviculisporaceae sp. PSN 640]